MMGEGSVLLWLQNSIRTPWLDALFSFYTKLGDAGLVFLLASLVLLLLPKTRKMGLCTLLALGIGALCTNVILKHLVARPRPWLDVAGLIPLVDERDPNSFPSGHTCAAFAFASAGLWSFPAKWIKALTLGFAALMGFSRLYVGVHYPSDVFAGAMVGLFAGWAACRLLSLGNKDRL